jgi:sugar lactone lactonase YvrE
MDFTSAGKLVIAEDETGCFGTYSSQGTFEGFTPAVVYMPPLAGIAVDAQDNVYVTEAAPGFSDKLVRFNPGGAATTITTGLEKPAGLAFYNNELYVAEFDAGRVSKVSSSGGRTTYIDGLTYPESIDFDQNGNLYVSGGASSADDTANYIDKVAPNKTISRFASLAGITLIKYDTVNDRLLVSASSGKVNQVSSAGVVTDFVSGLSSPMGIAFDQAGNIYISDDSIDAVYKLTRR